MKRNNDFILYLGDHEPSTLSRRGKFRKFPHRLLDAVVADSLRFATITYRNNHFISLIYSKSKLEI
jgi:hypothetical protein